MTNVDDNAPGGAGAGKIHGMHALQLSVLVGFVPAASLALALRRWIGAGVLCLNIFTSVISNRPAARGRELFDYVDGLAICLWGAYNTFVAAQVVRALCTNLAARRLALLICALIFAGASGVADVARRRLPFRSKREVHFHAIMHLLGSVGTILLLVSTINSGTALV